MIERGETTDPPLELCAQLMSVSGEPRTRTLVFPVLAHKVGDHHAE